jgi:hypothetical protein
MLLVVKIRLAFCTFSYLKGDHKLLDSMYMAYVHHLLTPFHGTKLTEYIGSSNLLLLLPCAACMLIIHRVLIPFGLSTLWILRMWFSTLDT